MKMYEATKLKMAAMRLRRIKEYYNAYDYGWSITLKSKTNSKEKCTVLAKRQLNDKFYFVVQNKYGAISLANLVYCAGIEFIRVPRASKKYVQNKEIFDSWIQTEKDKRAWWMREAYNFASKNVAIKAENDVYENYELVLKKEFKKKYYFVLKVNTDEYMIVKLDWGETAVKVVPIKETEYNNNRNVFESWLEEAKEKAKN